VILHEKERVYVLAKTKARLRKKRLWKEKKAQKKREKVGLPFLQSRQAFLSISFFLTLHQDEIYFGIGSSLASESLFALCIHRHIPIYTVQFSTSESSFFLSWYFLDPWRSKYCCSTLSCSLVRVWYIYAVYSVYMAPLIYIYICIYIYTHICFSQDASPCGRDFI